MINNNLKIAMVTDSFFPIVGGSETAIRNLSLGFLKQGHQVKVYGLFDGVKSPDPQLEVIYVPPKVFGLNLRALGRLINLRKEIKKYKPDIINAHFMLMSGWAGVLAAKKFKIASVVTVRGKCVFYKAVNLKQKFLYEIYRRTSLRADMMIATSAEMADMVEEGWGRRPIPLSNGVDSGHFKPDIKTDLRRKLNLENKKIILCVRRFVPKNGIEYIIRALPKIFEKERDIFLILVAPKGREYENLKKLSEEINISERILFAGEIDHLILPQYFSIADLVVQPSIAEARSLSCLEAMASGRAIVATDTGGLKELIEHKKNGFLIPAFEKSTYNVGVLNQEGVANLANAVLEVLADENLRKIIKTGARKTAELHNWDAICGATLNIYKEAIEINKKKQGL